MAKSRKTAAAQRLISETPPIVASQSITLSDIDLPITNPRCCSDNLAAQAMLSLWFADRAKILQSVLPQASGRVFTTRTAADSPSKATSTLGIMLLMLAPKDLGRASPQPSPTHRKRYQMASANDVSRRHNA